MANHIVPRFADSTVELTKKKKKSVGHNPLLQHGLGCVMRIGIRGNTSGGSRQKALSLLSHYALPFLTRFLTYVP